MGNSKSFGLYTFLPDHNKVIVVIYNREPTSYPKGCNHDDWSNDR